MCGALQTEQKIFLGAGSIRPLKKLQSFYQLLNLKPTTYGYCFNPWSCNGVML